MTNEPSYEELQRRLERLEKQVDDRTRAERALQEGGTEPGAIWKLPVLSLWS